MSYFPAEQQKNPSRRLNQAPNQILPETNQSPLIGWGPKPTGYYPDMNGETTGRFDQGPVPIDPQARTIPTEPGSNHERVDQHAYMQVSSTWVPTPIESFDRPSGGHDPAADGPVAPVPRLLSLFNYRGSGTTRTRFMDVPDGRKFSATGSQDGVSTTWYENAATQTAPYVDRQSFSNIGIDPQSGEVIAQQNADSLMMIPSGPDHGWTSVPVVDVKQDNQKMRQLKQQQYVTQNRRANSTYAGQTYGQRTAVVANPPGNTPGQVPTWRSRG